MEQKKPNNKIVKKDIEFQGKVIEVHSGDTLTIASLKSGRQGRFCLTNVRAPQIFRNSYKPWAFEAKEFIRKLVIGKEVKVKMEYEKTFTVSRDVYDEKSENVIEVQEQKTSIFALVEFEGKQLAAELLAKGYANLQRPYTEEEQSAIYDDLKEVEAVAKKKNIGIHKQGDYKPRNFNDLTQKENQNQAKNVFQYFKDSGKFTGVVELVLNGSRLKVRVNEQNCYLMMVLQGVRCLPNDENIPGYEIWSNKALEYSKSHILQRDVDIYINKVDKKGIFQGTILINKKFDYAEQLLKEGLAVTFGANDKTKSYERIENEARSAKKGLWGQNLNLAAVKGDFGQKEVQKVSGKFKAMISEVIDINEFYYQVPGNAQLKKIDQELQNYDPTGRATLKNPKPNTPCLALFSVDDTFYRAKIVREVVNKKDKYLVHFVDYGNYEEVHIEDIRKLPEQYLNIPPQAIKCGLAYIEGPNKKHQNYDDSIDAFMDRAWEKKVEIHHEYKYGDTTSVLLYLQGEVDINSSVNQALLKEGLSRLDRDIALPQSLQNWQLTQEKAQDKGYGVWQNEEQ